MDDPHTHCALAGVVDAALAVDGFVTGSAIVCIASVVGAIGVGLMFFLALS
jgi:hypothetical protein